jgi:hypothetical protein
VRPVEAPAELGQDDREQRDRDRNRYERNQHPGVPHRAQKGERQRDQSKEPDRDRDAAEDDGASRRLHCLLHRRLSARAACALLPPARDHEQRVVDCDAQADECDQELDDGRDVGRLRQQHQRHEAGHDRDEGHQQRHEREERGEDEEQHQERPEAADQHFDEHARPLVVRSAVLHEGVDAREPDRRTGHRQTL